MNILCPNPESFSLSGLDFCKRKAFLEAVEMTQSEVELHARKYDAVLIRFNTRINNRIINSKSKVKYVISPTTGLDHIDMNLADKFGVKVFHLRNEKQFLKTVSGTAELTIGIMISLLRNIHTSFDSVKSGFWDVSKFRGHELIDKTIGIIGYGRLGQMVADVCRAFRMKVTVYDPYIKEKPEGVKVYSDIGDILTKSDIISVHVPLNQDTKYMISRREFIKMKNTSIIINTSRGAIIDNDALLQALESNEIAGAALDVIENEHDFLGKSHPLIAYSKKNKNLLITPHIGGATYESVEKTDLFLLKKFFKDYD